ncbi:MAG: hypothetical protein ABIP94_14635 [Planctomycetota bacterium]
MQQRQQCLHGEPATVQRLGVAGAEIVEHEAQLELQVDKALWCTVEVDEFTQVARRLPALLAVV